MVEFAELQNIQLFLLDMDGTFYLGDKLLPGAKDFIGWLNRHEKRFLFLTNNSSKHSKYYSEKLTRMGVPVSENEIFSSGKATALYLKSQKPDAKVFVVGTTALQEELSSFDVHLVQENPDFVLLGFDTTLTYDNIWKLCDFVRVGFPYIATHPDINCPTENGFMPDIGSMISMVAASTGRQPDLIVGKPNRTIIDMLVKKTGISTYQMAMIGDRLYTDIAMGQAGLKTILVLSGEAKLEDLPGSRFKPDYIVNNLADLVSKLS